MSDKSYKMVLLGDTSVGKSSFIHRYISGEYLDYQEPTIGASFMTKNIITPDESTKKLEIWDTAGQERYRSLAPMYYRSASIALIVFDVTREDSLNGSKKWIEELNKNNPDCLLYLIGNKIDLIKEESTFKEKINLFCSENNITNFYVSAKTGKNIDETFDYITNNLPENFINRKINTTLLEIEKDNSYYCCQ